MTIQLNGLWIGDRLSNLEVLSIKSHLRCGHAYRLWTYGPVENVPSGAVLSDGNEILPESEIFSYRVGEGAGSVSAFSNLFRYKLLAERGGWWSDTDVVSLRPFDFSEDFVFASERSRYGYSSPTTCVIGCKSPNGVLGDCYKMAKRLKDTSVDKLKWGSLGPQLFERVLFSWSLCDLNQYVQPPHVFCPVNWFDAEFDPPVHEPPDLSKSHAVHLWHEMWRRRGINKDGEHGEGCLFERLKNDILLPAG